MNKVYEIITEKITQQLEKGIIPWEKPWNGGGAWSHTTGKAYSFINQLLLEKGEYITFEQCKAEGGQIRKGAKSHLITFWKIYTKEEENEEKEITIKNLPILRYYRVFNIKDCIGIEQKYSKPCSFTEIEEPQTIVDKWGKIVPIFHSNSDKAYYAPSEDAISLPLPEQFKKPNMYYATAFHEMIHSTGAPGRLARGKKGAASFFGGEEYSKEELVAEIGSYALCNITKISDTKTEEQAIAYCQSWLSVLKSDVKMIINAAAQAEKAVNYIFDNIK